MLREIDRLETLQHLFVSFQYQLKESQREKRTQPMHLSVKVPWIVLPWYTMAAVRPQNGFPFDCEPIISTGL